MDSVFGWEQRVISRKSCTSRGFLSPPGSVGGVFALHAPSFLISATSCTCRHTLSHQPLLGLLSTEWPFFPHTGCSWVDGCQNSCFSVYQWSITVLEGKVRPYLPRFAHAALNNMETRLSHILGKHPQSPVSGLRQQRMRCVPLPFQDLRSPLSAPRQTFKPWLCLHALDGPPGRPEASV